MYQNVCIPLQLDCITCCTGFRAKRIDMSMSLNGTKHMYIDTAREHMLYMYEYII